MTQTNSTQITEALNRLREIAHRDSATKVTVCADDLRLLLSSDNTQESEYAHHAKLLGQALGECIQAAGITRPDASLTGPELLLFAEDLKIHLEITRQVKSDVPSVLGWKVRERRHVDGTLLGCFVEAPAAPGAPYALEVLGGDYTGYGNEEGKLAHCNLIVALANSAGSVRDVLNVGAAEVQYQEAAKAFSDAVIPEAELDILEYSLGRPAEQAPFSNQCALWLINSVRILATTLAMSDAERPAFEKWMLNIEHPVIGWITPHWFERGDDTSTYAKEYVQGAWVAFKVQAVRNRPDPELPLAERMKAAGMITVDELMSGSPLDAFMVHNGVNSLETFYQWLEMKRLEFVSMQARFTLDKREDDEMFEWVLAHAAVFGEVLINFKVANPQSRKQLNS
jgi:hypothetical protein